MVITLHCITGEAYEYLLALNLFESADYDVTSMMEPAIIPSNVRGGIGFVSVEACISKTFTLPSRELE